MQRKVDPMVGKVIGSYTITRFVARGGFGVVYLCKRNFDKSVWIVKSIDKKSPGFMGPDSEYYQKL
jgi:serine/threonine protein kinase